MKIEGVPRALLAVVAVGIAVLAGIGTAGSFGDGGSLWGEHYDGGSASGGPAGASAQEPTVLRAPAIRATIDTMSSAFREALVDGDHGTLVELYAEDAVHLPAMAPPVRGREALRAHLEDEVPEVAGLTFERREVRVLSPEWATEHGTVLIRTGAGDEGPAPETELSYALLFQKTSDGWKIRRDVESPNGPPAGER